MKALVYKEPFKMELEEIPAPQVQKGEVLVRVRSVGACGSDIHGFSGKTGRRYPGMVMGHEISGSIAESGPEGAGLVSGKKVVIQPIIYCGECEMCALEKTSVCLNKKMIGVNMGTTGGLSEMISVPIRNIFSIDEKVPYPVAALVEPFAVGEGAAFYGDLRGGETVCIVGSGTIGLTILLMVLQRKPEKVFIIDQSRQKLDLA
ncbi:MAG: galactitol-1-phosphate 5-dehydrogenase, partial [Spirochaetales bacterium]